jgi:sugar lactone lactonase YvrE
MSNNRDFIVKNAVEVGGATKVTLGDAAAGGSYTQGYDLANASYDSVSFSIAAQDTAPYALFMRDDGLKMYMLGNGNDVIYQYSLSTANDLSTASYDSVSFSVASQTTGAAGVFFKSDGTKMYIGAFGGTHSVYQYSLSTAWDVSSASYDSVSFSRASQSISHINIFFKPDGTKMYSVNPTADAIFEYGLSTAWDVSTASYNGSLSVSAEDSNAYGMWFKNDGTQAFISGLTNDSVFRYDLSTAWDVTSGSYSGVSFSVTSQETSPNLLTFSADGAKMFVGGVATDTIYQYSTGSTVTTGSFDLSTGNYFTDTPSADVEYTFSNAGDVQTVQVEVTGGGVGYGLSTATYDNISALINQGGAQYGVAYKTDGTHFYFVNNPTAVGYQYNLSTGWDVSTMSYSNNSKNFSSQDSAPTGIDISSDGTKMYIVGITNNTVYQYTLSTAYDISTASYASKSFSVSSQSSNPRDIAFKTDGTKMYLCTTSPNDAVYQYSLSTAWDISTASYDSVSLSLSSQTTGPNGMSISQDGKFMLVTGGSSTNIYQYVLSTAWDLSTASYDSVLDVDSVDTGELSAWYNDDGTKMFFSGYTSDRVYQFSSSTAITITWDADIEWAGGTAPDSPAAGEKDLYTITTDDGGATYFGVQSGDAFS